jgi:cbb3-type cytochrome oxidase maturation protein
MSVILVLIIISMLVAGGFLAAFVWATRSGQYEDTFSPAVRILFEHKEKNTANDQKKEVMPADKT